MALIQAYGEFWNPDLVEWQGTRGPRGEGPQLLGKRGGKEVNLWDQLGIYVLLHEWNAVYVGRVAAETRSLGARLREHRSDHLAGRWDRFSWYGTRRVNQDGSLGKPAAKLSGGHQEVINTLEAVLLKATPSLNKSQPKIPDAVMIRQVGEVPATALSIRIEGMARDLDDLRGCVERLTDQPD